MTNSKAYPALSMWNPLRDRPSWPGGVARSAGVVVQVLSGPVCLNLIHHPVCGFAAATPPGQEGRSL